MPSPFFQELSAVSSTVLPQSFTLLQQAQRLQLKIAPTWIASGAAFAKLAEATGVISDNSDVAKTIRSVKVPTTLTTELHHLLHRPTKTAFVRIQAWTQFGETTWISELKGETNVAEALLESWSAASSINLRHGLSPLEAVRQCQAVIQLQPATPQACGELLSRHPDTGERHLVAIRIWPGAPHPGLSHEKPTTYAIDIRTNAVVQRELGASRKKAHRRLDSVVLTTQPETAEFLDDRELLELAQQFTDLKRHYPHHLQARFEVFADDFWLTAVEPFTMDLAASLSPDKLATNIYLATGSANSLDLTNYEECDGLGLLRAEHVIARLEIHPLELIKKGKSALITDRLNQFFADANRSYPSRRIIYRLQNFTSRELQALTAGDRMETNGPNPYLGWRGGLRLIEQPELFEPELATFGKWLKHRHAPTGLLVPFVRSTAEWRWVLNRWREREFDRQAEFEIWFQVTTPENLFHLDGYLMPEVKGVILNVRTVTALMSGIDPDDPQLQASYPPPIELQQSILEDTAAHIQQFRDKHAHHKLQLMVHLEDFNHTLVTAAVKLGFSGVVINPAALTVARSSIRQAEHDRLSEQHQLT